MLSYLGMQDADCKLTAWGRSVEKTLTSFRIKKTRKTQYIIITPPFFGLVAERWNVCWETWWNRLWLWHEMQLCKRQLLLLENHGEHLLESRPKRG